MNDVLAQKVTARSLVDVVAERLEAAIISGALQPGAKLSEQGLAVSLGVSRGPLREAIRRLEGRKLLHRTPNIGVRVATVSLRHLHEVLQVRERLEGLACALAARTMSDAQVAELAASVDRLAEREAAGNGADDSAEDFRFHEIIVSACRNERLKQLLADDYPFLSRLYSNKFGARERGPMVLEERRAILSAIVRRDPPAAEDAMRIHLRNARRYVEEQMAIADGPAEAIDAARVTTL